MTQNQKGFLVGLLGIFCFSSMLVMIRLAHSVSSEVIAFARVVGVFLFTLPFVIKDRSLLKAYNVKLHLVRVLCFFVGNFSVWYLVSKMYLVNASLLISAAPPMLPILSFLFLKQQISRKKLLAILLGFIGCAFILHPKTDAFSQTYFLSLLVPLSAALSLICIHKLSETEKSITILFYYSFFSSLIAGALMIPHLHHISFEMGLYLFLIGLSSTLFQLFITKAYSIGAPAVIGPVTYFDVIFCSFFGWLIWDERITPYILFGSLIIITSGLYIIFADKIFLKQWIKNLTSADKIKDKHSHSTTDFFDKI